MLGLPALQTQPAVQQAFDQFFLWGAIGDIKRVESFVVVFNRSVRVELTVLKDKRHVVHARGDTMIVNGAIAPSHAFRPVS